MLKIQQLSWDEVKKDIQLSNPALFNILKEVKRKHDFIKAYYDFGDRIVNQGQLCLSTADGSVAVNSASVPIEIQNYSSVPIGLILTKCVEVFFETKIRLMPSKLCAVGSTIGLKTTFDPQPSEFTQNVMNMSAGTRTIFMLPKIGDATAHARLKKKYNLLPYAPKNFLEQCNVFSSLAKNQLQKNSCRCEILFFCGGWLEENADDINCIKLT